MKTITLTQNQLTLAIAQWENLNRAGGTIGADAMAAKPVDEVATESAEYLWGVLQEIVAG